MDGKIIVLYIGNVIVGTLEVDMPEKTFLINLYILEEKNRSVIVQLFDNLFYVFITAKRYKTRPCFTFLPRDVR